MLERNALNAPFPYFGGKSRAASQVWEALGEVKNYVEPFCGSAAMLLGAPDGRRVETINDADGFVANFWRSISKDPEAVAHYCDWPVNESDLVARHLWLIAQDFKSKLDADSEWCDPKIAGWWCWGACNWIGSGWCSGEGPWVLHEGEVVNKRKLPHLGDAGQGINRKLPHLGNAGQGINRKLPHLSAGRGEFIGDWFQRLHNRLRDVRVVCGDWSRVAKDSVTTRHGLTGVFLDPPYRKGAMDYAVQSVGSGLDKDVSQWCVENGSNPKLRIVICGHVNDHDELLMFGWHTRKWVARKGYALSNEAVTNTKGETLWCSPHCVPEVDDVPGWLKLTKEFK